jgi:hypothetical protein
VPSEVTYIKGNITGRQDNGSTANRPSYKVSYNFGYFDTTLGYMVYWNGTSWVDSVGGIV